LPDMRFKTEVVIYEYLLYCDFRSAKLNQLFV